MKKKLLTTLIAAVMVTTMVACSSGKPSDEEITKAISDGAITIEDALEKGWIDEKWIDKNVIKVPSTDKTKSNLLGDFTTTTLQGDEFTLSDISAATFIYFFNPNSEEAMLHYEKLNEVYDQIKQEGGDLLGVIVGGDANADNLKNSKFTLVNYNDSMKKAMGNSSKMIQPDGFTGAWNVNTSFLSAWFLKIDTDALVEGTAEIINFGNGDAKSDAESKTTG